MLNANVINDYILSSIPNEENVYLSFDSICKVDSNVNNINDLYTPVFLNNIRMKGLLNHMLKLKAGASVALLMNINRSLGLYNGAGLIISQLEKYVFEATILVKKL